jgi:hypothetical protein
MFFYVADDDAKARIVAELPLLAIGTPDLSASEQQSPSNSSSGNQ